ncbi:N-acetylneuraminate synthase family protein [Deltaproteobacteria bacterium]|nr:N-acetylneuraminate synthase family protein [Deltaproteobacteria bacterium]
MRNEIKEPLFIFEMANNHMGSVAHGLKIIQEFASVKQGFNFNFAFKLQLRDIDTFIHPDYQSRMDIKYVKRFSETKLSDEEVKTLLNEMKRNSFISVCTGFDEKSIDLMENLDFDIFKIASCSFTDWPLLERIALTDKPVIVSTAGSSLDSIDAVVSFFQHRGKSLSLMHCVGEYPTKNENLQLNQIDLFINRYPDVAIGFSTHEDPDNLDPIKIAIAKGAVIFEKHVAVETEKYPKNDYSATPEQVEKWLDSAKRSFEMCGISGKRASFSDKELSDLKQFKRGVFAARKIKNGELITPDIIFHAFPNMENQVVANDMSKYIEYRALKDIETKEPVLLSDVARTETREKVYSIVQEVKGLLKNGNIVVPGKAALEISHHYGLDDFIKYGITMITVVNREYCKKLIVVLPGQKHPEQFHEKKEETFVILHGEIELILDGETISCGVGDIVTVKPGMKHAFNSEKGAVIEEISSTHYVDDSFYSDPSIMKNKQRKTCLSYWMD